MNNNSHINLCPNKELCGSCGWSHIPYTKQLKQKISDISGSLALNEIDLEVKEIIPAPKTHNYRNRMDFVIDFEGRFGMRQKGKWWKVIDNHHCFIADEKIEQAFSDIYNWLQETSLTYFDRKAHHGFLRYAVIRTTSTGELMLNIITSKPENNQEKEELLKLIDIAKPTTLIWSINNTITDVSFGDELITLHGPGYITEIINDIKYQISPNAFFQTNPHGAKILMDTVIQFAGEIEHKKILDLYCGTGFFALALAKHKAQQVSGIEIVHEAILDAQRNAQINNLDIHFETAKTEDYNWQDFNPDLVIIDPPRSGMHDNALNDILKNKPKELIYISCNYKHFAREMKKLQEIYQVDNIKAVDMFPHTPHVELIAKMTLI